MKTSFKLFYLFFTSIILNFSSAENFINYNTTEVDTIYFNDFELNDGGFYDPNSVAQVDPVSEDKLWTWGTSSTFNANNVDSNGYKCWATNNGNGLNDTHNWVNTCDDFNLTLNIYR